MVVAHVGADGRVVSASIQNARGAPTDVAAFSRMALDSVQNWTFNPARKNGDAVPGDALVPVIFSDTDATSDELPENALNAIHVRTPNYKAGETEDKPPSENIELSPRESAALSAGRDRGEAIRENRVESACRQSRCSTICGSVQE